MFDPSQTLTPAAAPLVIPPLPNSRKPTNADNPSSSLGYGLTVRNTDTKRKLAPPDAARGPSPPSGPSGDLMLRQFKQDMAILPDIQGMDEYEEVPVEGFGAALLAGYGWKQGHTIGKNKTKGDAKVVERVRRFGTHGIGFKPSKKTTT
jgi:G patch domain/KOW motif-containing protein